MDRLQRLFVLEYVRGNPQKPAEALAARAWWHMVNNSEKQETEWLERATKDAYAVIRAAEGAKATAIAAERRYCFMQQGVKVFDNGEAWISYRVFQTGQVEKLSDEALICMAGMESCYSGPGMFFANDANIYRGRCRTIVTQRCGYDI